MPQKNQTFYNRYLKRLIDVLIVLCSAIVVVPVVLVVALIVRLKLGSPIFFRQQRPGLDGKPFMMIKFRSMTSERDEHGELLPDAQRLTAFGQFLRRSSLDELPELWNVLKGEMSLVGPRPLLMQYLARYTPEQARRHAVRPGITGWAQVNGRNAITWEEKFRLDAWYVDHASFWLDMKILGLTFLKVVKRDGISAEGETTMHEFMGSEGE